MYTINNSEVARIKQQITLESDAARSALYGSMKGAAKHSFITKRMENMGKFRDKLAQCVGSDEATKFLIGTMNEEASATQNRKASIQEHLIPGKASRSSQSEGHADLAQYC